MLRAMFLLLALAPLAVGQSVNHDHSGWDSVLQNHVSAIGEVDYESLAADRAAFDRYLGALAEASPDAAPRQFQSREQKLAYWLNAYNAFTIKGVLDSYPLESIRKVSKFFDKRVYDAGGRQVSLNDIEHRILRKRFQDPRIHAAIVCASVSCPALWNRAFTAAAVDEQLDSRAAAFVNQRRNVTVEADAKRVTLSKIFDWFSGDFDSGGGVMAFIRKHAAVELETRLQGAGEAKLKFHSYDWSLNEPGSRAASGNPLERELTSR